MSDEQKTKVPRGFGALPPEKLRELSKRGGEAAHRSGRAHKWTKEEAQVAGRKGGLARAAKVAP